MFKILILVAQNNVSDEKLKFLVRAIVLAHLRLCALASGLFKKLDNDFKAYLDEDEDLERWRQNQFRHPKTREYENTSAKDFGTADGLLREVAATHPDAVAMVDITDDSSCG